MVLHGLIMVLGVFMASVAQVLLKKSAQKKYVSVIWEYLNWRVILGYSMMLFATLCSVFAYKVIPISLAMVLDATGYIFVTLFGIIIFKEIVTRKRLFALMLILSGIVVYSVLG